VVIDSNRVQVVDSDAKVWLGKRGASLGMWGEDAEGALQVGWYASGDNAGAILAGAGATRLDENGVTVTVETGAAFDDVRSYRLDDGAGTVVGRLTGYVGAEEDTIVSLWAHADYGGDTFLDIFSDCDEDGHTAEIQLKLLRLGSQFGSGSFIRMHAATNWANVWSAFDSEFSYNRFENGVVVGNLTATPGIGAIIYTGSLTSYKNSTDYEVSGFKYLTAPLTSTSWDGDSYSTTAKTKIDLSAVFSAPAGVKAVLAYVTVRDSDSANGDYWLILSPNDTAGQGFSCKATHSPNDSLHSYSCIIPCDASGDIYYQINAHDTETLDAWIQIWGYAI